MYLASLTVEAWLYLRKCQCVHSDFNKKDYFCVSFIQLIHLALLQWKRFENGIVELPEAQRETFFRECGKNCVQYGTLQIYKDLYEQVAGDLDQFFAKANELPGVRCETIEKGSVYNLYFIECTCGLYKQGYVSTPLLCECSKQSILYVLQSLWKDRTFQVTICESILRGSQHCKMRIEASNTDFAEFETKI